MLASQQGGSSLTLPQSRKMRQKITDLAEQISWGNKLPQWLLNMGERFLGFRNLNLAHNRIEEDWENGSSENFFALACRYLNLLYDVSGLENIPKEGPCVIVSNHPHGLSDGLMFGDVAMRVRSDVRIVVNEWLHCVRGMRPYTITVDVYGGEKAKRANIAGMKEMLQWLRQGHCILVFPSGSAASYSTKYKCVTEDPWQTNIASVIRKTQATVVPMHISGRTGTLFQIVTVLAKDRRAALLPREIKRDGRMRHRIALGKLLPPNLFKSFSTDGQLSDFFRLHSRLLSYADHDRTVEAKTHQREFSPIASHIPKEQLQEEMNLLPPSALLYANPSARLEVYAISAERSPRLMRELSVCREETFRAVGEGTGESMDRDAYDEYYTHLVMWDAAGQAIAGSYRIGRSDLIINQKGISSLYNAAFFHFDKTLYPALCQGLEMGRAFITRDFQRHPAALDTLWMAIGQYLKRYPQYRYLYGTVSISQEYSDISRALMLEYLKRFDMHGTMAGRVVAKTPPTGGGLRREDSDLLPSAIPDPKALGITIASLERDGKALPVLLRQYLRLGGKFLSFNIDNNFGGTLDCLVWVDLAQTPQRMLQRYMGKDFGDRKQEA